MFNDFDVLHRDLPSKMETPTKVGDTNQYEGKDNPGVPWYYQRRQKKKKESKPAVKSNSKIDLLA